MSTIHSARWMNDSATCSVYVFVSLEFILDKNRSKIDKFMQQSCCCFSIELDMSQCYLMSELQSRHSHGYIMGV